MIKGVFQLFSASFIGRLLGLLRFQALLFVFGQGIIADSIIYITTFIWLINNFFLIPTVNSSLIADLGKNDKCNHAAILAHRIRKLMRISLLVGLVSVIFLYVYEQFAGKLLLDITTLMLIFVILMLMGINEVFSLFNQFQKKYLVYALNPAIWNTVLILSIILYNFLNYKEIWIYFLFLLLSLLISLSFQIFHSKLGISNVLAMFSNKKDKLGSLDLGEKNIYYKLTIVFFSGLTFFDFNLVSSFGPIGIITTYSVLIKLPELFQSIINGSLLPVIFNNIVLGKVSFLSGFLKFTLLSVLCFSVLSVVYILLGDFLFQVLFNFDVMEYVKDLQLALVYLLISTLAFFFIRLSVEYKFQKRVFVFALIGLFLKLVFLLVFEISVSGILLSNALALLAIVLAGIYSLFFTIDNNHYTVKTSN